MKYASSATRSRDPKTKYALIGKDLGLLRFPITFIDRERGTSKMNSGIFKEAIIGVLQMRFGGWSQGLRR